MSEGKASCPLCSGAGSVTEFDTGETTPCPCAGKDGKRTKAPSMDELEGMIRRIAREEIRKENAKR